MCRCHGLSLGYHLYNSAVSAVTQASLIPGHSRTVCETCTLQEIMVQVMIMLHLGSRSGDEPELKQWTDACILWRSCSFICTQRIARVTTRVFFYLQNNLLPVWQNPFLCHGLGCSALKTRTFPLVQNLSILQVGCGEGLELWRQKCLWSIISLSNSLGTNKYGFCSCLLAFKTKLNYLK